MYESVKPLEPIFGIKCFSNEFEILLNLYLYRDINVGELMPKIQCSTASFNNVKNRLLDRELIIQDRSENDKRSIIVNLNPLVRQKLEEINYSPIIKNI